MTTRRRVAPAAVRCTAQPSQWAVRRARRLGQPVEERCARRRQGDSPFCTWHQPGYTMPPRHRLTDAQVLDFLAARAALIRRHGAPDGDDTWWRTSTCYAQGFPTMTALAATHGLTVTQASLVLSFKAYQRPSVPPHRPLATWRDRELIALIRSIVATHGAFPDLTTYRAWQVQNRELPYDTVLRRFGGGGPWERVSLMAAVPLQPSTRRRYRPEERAFLEDHAGFLSVAEMAARLGRSTNSVRSYMSKHGISFYHEAGYLTANEASRLYHISPTTLRRATDRGAVPHVPGRRGVQANGSVQKLIFLDPLDVEHWLARRSSGLALAGG